ncbi:MAG TPA: M23 family metallopeptidase, partial [Flavisolibacter sp.]|nr:M23 family metallopeptidase [Flavisolibacter sp.]
IDIFAKKGTSVVAIADGVIVSKENTPIGGKVLWLKSAKHTWTAYYAHLDKQLVKEGQTVRKGQVIGTVGKTGNARSTPPHLHFGIATRKGWENPLPYVKNSPKVLVKAKKR